MTLTRYFSASPRSRLGLLLVFSCAVHAALLAGYAHRDAPGKEVGDSAVRLGVVLVSPPAAEVEPLAEAVVEREVVPEQPPSREKAVSVRKPEPRPVVTTAAASAVATAPARMPPPLPHAGDVAEPKADETTAEVPPSAPPLAGGPAATASLEEAYKAALRQEIAQHRHYPRLARRLGQEGRVEVGFEVLADGRLSNVRVVHGSGFERLDEAAVETVERLGRFRPLPPELDRARWPLVVPLDFTLL